MLRTVFIFDIGHSGSVCVRIDRGDDDREIDDEVKRSQMRTNLPSELPPPPPPPPPLKESRVYVLVEDSVGTLSVGIPLRATIDALLDSIFGFLF